MSCPLLSYENWDTSSTDRLVHTVLYLTKRYCDSKSNHNVLTITLIILVLEIYTTVGYRDTEIVKFFTLY